MLPTPASVPRFVVLGLLGRRDLLSACRRALADPVATCADAAARSAILLGDRSDALATLEHRVLAAPISDDALGGWRLLLGAVALPRAHSILAGIASDPAQVRAAIHGSAATGNPHYVPWLITRMGDPALAPLAGDAFTCITGAELAPLRLELQPALSEPARPIDEDAAPAPESADDAIVPIDDDIAVVRKPIGPDHDLIKHWVAARFGPGWASEAQVALSNRPVTL